MIRYISMILLVISLTLSGCNERQERTYTTTIVNKYAEYDSGTGMSKAPYMYCVVVVPSGRSRVSYILECSNPIDKDGDNVRFHVTQELYNGLHIGESVVMKVSMLNGKATRVTLVGYKGVMGETF